MRLRRIQLRRSFGGVGHELNILRGWSRVATFFSANAALHVQTYSTVMNGWIKIIAAAALVFVGCAAPLSEALRVEVPHWAFQPIRDPHPPRVQNEAWVQNPIDRFILAKLEAANLQPAPRAPNHILNRRAHFALTGLPPKSNSFYTQLSGKRFFRRCPKMAGHNIPGHVLTTGHMTTGQKDPLVITPRS